MHTTTQQQGLGMGQAASFLFTAAHMYTEQCSVQLAVTVWWLRLHCSLRVHSAVQCTVW